jgi:acyl-coenzyme A thioesterase 9
VVNPFTRLPQHVFVNANVIDVKSGAELSTNDFRFTWCDKDGEQLERMVVPRTYAGGRPVIITFLLLLKVALYCIDAMSWIEGKRAVEMGEKIRGLRQPLTS